MATWREMSLVGLRSAKTLFDTTDFRGCANRAYYATYQAATAICVEHGDAFPFGWNNPAHEQLPRLIFGNGDLSLETRRRLVKLMRFLRRVREDADYRPGLTVDRQVARDCLRNAALALLLLEVSGEE